LATKDALKSPVRENRTPGSVGGRQLLEEEADLSTRQSPHIDHVGHQDRVCLDQLHHTASEQQNLDRFTISLGVPGRACHPRCPLSWRISITFRQLVKLTATRAMGEVISNYLPAC
ncbi:MAG: hypothetical protein QM270_03065, partial [Bacillota bacterium]|nr:hypothetical protein [Bacillota bacterium]